MEQLFPYANILVGILLFLVGFIFHWIGQTISLINWDFAIKIGLQEEKMPKEYKVYEHAIAVADCCLGWLYGLAAVGIFFEAQWGYKLLWIPGAILTYHSLSFWFWTRNRNIDNNRLESNGLRVLWFVLNMLTGFLSILLAWHAT